MNYTFDEQLDIIEDTINDKKTYYKLLTLLKEVPETRLSKQFTLREAYIHFIFRLCRDEFKSYTTMDDDVMGYTDLFREMCDLLDGWICVFMSTDKPEHYLIRSLIEAEKNGKINRDKIDFV